MEKYVCIHGHFYQPPRENPWLESVELQDSAWPYHDWNERITAECYAPNAAARILNGEGRVSRIVSNYAKISFNFGPTLLAWMKDNTPEIHHAILESDKASREHFSGHGSAMAQVYNHMIMPLANSADKYTQVLWGIRDFEARFGRKPEGMWLAETAADSSSLEVLARLGIKFTVLSPYQASRSRELGKKHWRDVNGGRIDPKRPYLVKLPGGKSISVFFYDAPVSQAVAFEKLLVSGDRLAHRMLGAFQHGRAEDQLVHIATDGESYGHHHKHGEMALAYALHFIESNPDVRLTNYGEYLEKHPPTHEVQIHERSAWSCVHGVGRWSVDCGCNSGGHGSWTQAWRAPLREALDWLRDQLGPLFETKGRELLRDPWAARNEYISVILDRSQPARDAWFARHAGRELNQAEQVRALKLMEMQRHAMLMYTSCGWFFDELSGIETVQVIQYAARAIQLANELSGQDFETPFQERLQAARSNIPEHRDGRAIYGKFVKPAMIDRSKAVAHYAISSVFSGYSTRTRIFSYTFEDEHRERLESGKTRLVVGRSRAISEITQSCRTMEYAILYMGEHNLTGGVRHFSSEIQYETMLKEVKAAYESADFPETIRRIDRHFTEARCSLKSLFKDEQRRILNEILDFTRADLESRFRLITERYAPLMKFLQGLGAPLPDALRTVSDMVLHSDIRDQLGANPPDTERLRHLFEEAQVNGNQVLDAEMALAISNRVEELLWAIAENPFDVDQMLVVEDFVSLVVPLPASLNLARAQDIYWRMLQETAPDLRTKAAAGEEDARTWMRLFLSLGRKLHFDVRPEEFETAPLEAAA